MIMTTKSTRKTQLKKKNGGSAAGSQQRPTPLRRTDIKYRETDDLYHDLFDTAHDAIIRSDIKSGIIVDVNKAGCRLLGLPKEKIIGRNQSEIHPPEKAEHYKELFRKYLEKGIGIIDPILVLRADGTLVPVEITTTVVNIADNTVIQGIFRDVTESQEMERTLIESEEKFGKAFHASPDAITISKLSDGTFLDANESFTRIIGYSRKELLGKNANTLNMWVNDTQRNKFLSLLRENVRLHDMEYEIRSKSGEIRTLLYSTEYVRIGGQPCALIVSEDITQRKKIEKSLRVSEEKFSKAFRAIPEMVSISTLKDGKFIDVNDSFLHQHHTTREEVIGHTSDELNLWQSEKRENITRRILEQGSIVNQELETRMKPGEKHTFSFSADVINLDGEPCMLAVSTDITERKQMENALRESEQKFSKAFHASPEIIIISDPESGMIYEANETFLRVFGYNRDEVVNQKSSNLGLWALPEERVEVLAQLKNKGAVINKEVHFRTKTGDVLFCLFSAEIINIGNTPRMLSVTTDITERKHMEEALQTSEEKYRNMVELATEGIFIMDLQGTILSCNQSLANIMGIDRQNIIGKKFNEFPNIDPAELRHSMQLFASLVGGEKIPPMELTWPMNDGTIHIYELRSNLIRDRDKINGIQTIVIDINERKRMEEALRTSEEKYRDIVELAAEGIYLTDLQGIMISCNQAFINMIGLDRKDTIGKHFTEFPQVDPVEIPRYLESFRSLLSGQKIPPLEVPWPMKDGTTRIYEIRSNLMKEGQEISKVQNIVIDITERKQIEQQLTDEATRRRILIEQSHDGIVILDQDGAVYDTNRRFADMLGRTMEEVRNLHAWDWEFLSSREQLLELLKTVGETGDYFATQHRRKDGSIYDVEISTNAAIFAGKKLIFCVCRDITERKKLEEKLRYSDTVLKSLQEGLFSMDTEGNITEWNDTCEQIYGVKAADAIGKKADKTFTIVEDYEGHNIKRMETLKKQGFSKEEQIHRTTHGDIWVDAHVQSISYGGKTYGWINLITDISERKKMEAKLRFSDIAMKSIHEGVFTMDKDMHITSWNEMCEQMIGVKASDAIGKHASDVVIVVEEYEGENVKRLEPLLTKGFNRTEQQYRTLLGDIWVDVQCQAMEYNGERYGWLTFFTDISARKKSEAALKRSEEKYHELIDTSNDAIISANSQMQFIVWNRGAEKLFGYTEKEILGQSIMTIFPSIAQGEVARELIRSKKSGTGNITSRVFETMGLKKDCSHMPIEVSISMRKSENSIVVTSIIRDITIRKEAEEKMQQLDQMKQDFLSNVSHELRTPLQSISGFTKLIMNGQVEDPATRQEFFEIIDRETQHLGNLINSLLDMSRLEAGRFQIYKKQAQVRDMVIEAIKLFHSLARDKNITLNEDIPLYVPEIEIDNERVRQVIINLLSNAIKFSEPGTIVALKLEVQKNDLLFQVSDQGTGMSEEAMEHLFERFYRAGEKVRGGTGLGLFISKQIVEAHGGRIWVESKPGEGSTFRFTLPLNNKGGNSNGNQ
jgi:PAS domain S-box-containing protein